jgi:hypothetical protein
MFKGIDTFLTVCSAISFAVQMCQRMLAEAVTLLEVSG